MIFAINQGKLPSPPDVLSCVFQLLWRFCGRCWQRDPLSRPPMSILADEVSPWSVDSHNNRVRLVKKLEGISIVFNPDVKLQLDISLVHNYDNE